METKKFSELTSGLQSIVFSLGLIAAGLWALFEFVIGQIETLDMDLQAEIKSVVDADYVEARLNIQNDGNKQVEFRIDSSLFNLTKVRFDGGEMVTENVDSFPLSDYMPVLKNVSDTTSMHDIIPPATNKHYGFVAELDEPGIYILEFSSAKGIDKYYWHATTTFVYNPADIDGQE